MTVWFYRDVPEHFVDRVDAYGFEPIGPALGDREGAVGIIAGSELYDGAVFDSLPNLKVLVRNGIGYDAVDLEAASERGILVANTPEGPTTSTAEHTIALMMAVAHELKASALRLRAQTGDYVKLQTAMELKGQTLGLIGFGRIGQAVAEIAKAIGMDVIVSDPAYADTISLDELLSRSDVVSMHVPAIASTLDMINADTLAKMKPGSILINCARGPVVDTDALVASLKSGHLMGAGLDVTNPEPLAADHPLLDLPNVIVTPHIASSTHAGKDRMLRMALEQLSVGLAGDVPSALLNPDALGVRR